MTTTPDVIRGPSREQLAEIRDHPTEWTGYVDTLEPCELNPEPSREVVPSVSKIRGVWPKFLTDWYATETAKLAHLHRDVLPGLSEDETVDLIGPAAQRKARAAAKRGHVIEEVVEAVILGEPLDNVWLEIGMGEDPTAYHDAIKLMVEKERPRLVASQVVVFGYGFGGTFDQVWEIDGDLWGVDVKSRGKGKAATRSEDEGAQLGAYFECADYWVIRDADGNLIRRRPMPLAGAMLMSVAPEKYRRYVVDLHHAATVFGHMRRFYEATIDASKMFERAKGHDVPQVAAEEPATDPAPTRVIGSATPLRKAPAPERKTFDEGKILDGDELQAEVAKAVRQWAAKVGTTGVEIIARVTTWRDEATRAGYPFRIHGDAGVPSTRRRGIYGAAVRLAAMTVDDDDARATIAKAVGVEVQPGHTVGAVLGQLTSEDAAMVRGHLDAVVVGPATEGTA